MKVLGLTLEQNSGCAIFDNDRIVFAASQERYSRKKSDEAYPIDAINDGLRFCNIVPNQLDKVVIAGHGIPIIYPLLKFYTNFSVKDHLSIMAKYWYPKLVRKEKVSMLDLFESKIKKDQFPFNAPFASQLDYKKIEVGFTDENLTEISNFYKKAISSHLNIEESKIMNLEHHMCHAAYAFYGSPIRDEGTLIFTADAEGDGLSATISVFDNKSKKIRRIKQYHSNEFQVARIYRYATLYLRMLPNEHEYKVMGLASYYDGPKVKEVEEVFDQMQSLDGLDFKYNNNIQDIFHHLQENLESYRFDHIAAGLQSFTEKILTKWIQNAVSEFGSKSVVFSGGTSMNVKANMKISQIPSIERFFVCGGGGDESLPLGSCYLYAETNNITPKPLDSLYLGPNSDYKQDIVKKAKNYKISQYTSPKQIVERILEGKIIATCLGRMEMGPRALCNRSIIADPRNRGNVEKINRKIKNRDFWMPFAPVVLYEYQDEILVNPKKIESPYMTIAFDTRDGKERIPAAVHQYDGTARPCILKHEMNPTIWEVIKGFYDITGIPALVNTSFNLHGEPLVNNIDDALYVFDNSGLDALWLDKHIIDKIE
ncbi:MAG: carbamoyl transferase [Thaumarchaeota archaeon]|nr:carbamoyl transferase [Nitrososphaerota archaeon]